jgi:hypothetical protein
MAGKKRKSSQPKIERVSKIPLWLKYFLDQDNLTTFFNKTESARAAGYKTDNYASLAQIGCRNYRRCLPKIKKWLDEVGISETQLKSQLYKLLYAKETKFQSIKGTLQEIDPSVRVLVKGTQDKFSQSGDHYTETENLVCIEVGDNKTQLKAVELGFKVQDLFPSERHEHNIRGNVQFVMELPPEDDDGLPDKTEIGGEDG